MAPLCALVLGKSPCHGGLLRRNSNVGLQWIENHPKGGQLLNTKSFVVLRIRRGHLSVEVSLVLVGVTVATIFAASFVGQAANCSFASIAQSNYAQKTKVAGESNTAATDSNAIEEDGESPVFVIIGLGCVMLTGLAGAIAHWRRRRPEPEQLPKHDPVSTAEHQSHLFEKRQNVLRILANDAQALFEGRITVGQLMSTHVRTVTPTLSIAELKKLCAEKHIRHLLVCDQEGRLTGVISDRDISVRLGQQASDIMTSNPITVTRETLVGPAMTAMLDHRFHCLPVVNGEKPCGMLTTSDLLMALQCALQLMTQATANSKA